MKKTFERIWTKLREVSENNGYVCDACGAEIFSYPDERLCNACETAMQRNDKSTCGKCGRETRAEGVCLTCKSRLPKFTYGLSPFVYRGETASLVNRVKNGTPRLARYFGENMARCFAEKHGKRFLETEESLLILPMPLTKAKEEERGYNQSERLAYTIALTLKKLGFAVETDDTILEKTRDTAQQKHMSHTERAENIAGAYHVHKRTACKDRSILLIDDIMTTGATGSECAARLLGAGAKEVYLLVAAALAENR